MELLHMLTLEFELVNQPSGTKNSFPRTKFPKPVLTSAKQNDMHHRYQIGGSVVQV